MAFPRLRTAAHRRRRAASESQQQRPRTAPALIQPPPPVPPRDLDTSTLHSSLAPTGPEPRHCSATLAPVTLTTSDGIREERDTSDVFSEGEADGPRNGGNVSGEGREDLIQHMRDQLHTANSVIRFLHEHVDGMREDRDRYRDRVEELKSLARLTLDMLEGAHRREWEVCREVRRVQEMAVEKPGAEEEKREEDKEKQPRPWRRRDSLMRKIGLGRKEGKDKEKEERRTKHDSARDDGDAQGYQLYENDSPTMPPIERPFPSSRGGGAAAIAAGSSSGNTRRKRGHVKSHSTTNARLRDDGVLTIPADELERLVQAMDRNVNVLREDIKKLVEEVDTHKRNPVFTSLTDVPPRFG